MRLERSRFDRLGHIQQRVQRSFEYIGVCAYTPLKPVSWVSIMKHAEEPHRTLVATSTSPSVNSADLPEPLGLKLYL